MYIIDKDGKQLEVTNLPDAIEQARSFKDYGRNYKHLTKFENERVAHWRFVYNALLNLQLRLQISRIHEIDVTGSSKEPEELAEQIAVTLLDFETEEGASYFEKKELYNGFEVQGAFADSEIVTVFQFIRQEDGAGYTFQYNAFLYRFPNRQ